MERSKDSELLPIFKKSIDGDFLAVRLPDHKYYLVVPRFNLIFQDSTYGPGAMGDVFVCENYIPKIRYDQIDLQKPASFEADVAQLNWNLKEKGRLILLKSDMLNS